MSHRAKYVNGKLAGWIPAGRQSPDYEMIFPDSFPCPGEMQDEYGNFCYELKNPGTEKAEFVKADVQPTAEQTSKVRKRRIAEDMRKAGYDRDDEIALIKDAIKALADGKPLPNEFTEMESVRQDLKEGKAVR
jgi:hypothetical protein